VVRELLDRAGSSPLKAGAPRRVGEPWCDSQMRGHGQREPAMAGERIAVATYAHAGRVACQAPIWTARVHTAPCGSPPEVAPSSRPPAVATTAREADADTQGELPCPLVRREP